MGSPVIIAVDPDPVALAGVERELLDRYERHYRVICVGSPAEARERVAELQVCRRAARARPRRSGIRTRTRAPFSQTYDERIRMRSGRCSSAGANGAIARRVTRSSRRSSTGGSTTTSSGPRLRRTSSSTRRSRHSCWSGRRSDGRRRTRSTWSATPGRAARTSSGRCSRAARSLTRSPSPTRPRGRACWEPRRRTSCPS